MALEVEHLLHEARFERALLAAHRLVQIRPEDEHANVLLAHAEFSTSRAPRARQRLERLVRAKPTSVRLVRTLATALRLEGKPEEALGMFERALELAPGDDVTRCALAEMRLLRGDGEGALETIRPIVERGSWDMNSAIVHALICQDLGREAEAIEPVERVLRDPGLPRAARCELLYRLGTLRDRLKLYDAAFGAFDEANRILGVFHDPDATERAIDEAIENWTPEAIERLGQSSLSGERVVLIVGMPRSGTSLVEQVLSSHPDVFGGDERGMLTTLSMELDPPARGQIPLVRSPAKIRKGTLGRAGSRYLKMLDELASGEARVTDKMPINLLHLGLARAMLPGLRVIHCQRDAQDTCLSCYFQGFSPALSFAFNLEHLGRFYRGCERIMAHWKRVLDIPIMDVEYEAMVDDQASMARRLVEFIGLPWDDACLRFHETKRVQMTSSNQQVRRPIYRTSLKRHEHYTAHLGALRRGLGIDGAESAARVSP